MKELSVEEKAKRYDSMFERLKEMYNNNKTNVADRLIYERYFPELKESENKRMIQYFKDLAPFDKADELYEKYGFSHKDAIAWLEKQGEHSNFLSKIQVGDKVTRNEDGVLVNLSQLNRVAKKDEKQGEKGTNGNNMEIPNSEQEPADKVEPKFKVGDWIYHEISGNTFHINRIENRTYISDEGATISFGRQKDWRLWIIQDAKDGDVLADGVGVILFRKIGNKKDANVVDYHCAVFKSGSFIIQKGVSYWGYSNDEQLRPATKEQCERFFATMRDVGYEWDADKKELKKLREE